MHQSRFRGALGIGFKATEHGIDFEAGRVEGSGAQTVRAFAHSRRQSSTIKSRYARQHTSRYEKDARAMLKSLEIPGLLLLTGALVGFGPCGDEAEPAAAIAPGTPSGAPVAAAPGAPAVPPAAAVPAGPGTLVVGAPAATLAIPAAPSFNFTVSTMGEYQIDVMGQPMDAKVLLYQGDQHIETDDDGGDGNNARIVRFLAPATYSLRIHELRGRAATVQVSAALLPPMPSAGVVTPETPLTVNVPGGAEERTASAEVTLTIAQAGSYTIDAIGVGDIDPKMQLIQNMAQVASNDDGGEGNNAQIRRQLAAGTYQIRIFDFRKRPGQIMVRVSQ